MQLDEFISNFADQFDETDPSEFTASTEFREIEEWSSLSALSIIAMVDEEYQVKVTGDDIRSIITIKELFDIVKSRK